MDNIQAAIDAGKGLAGIQRVSVQVDGTSAPVMVVPQGHKVEMLSLEQAEKWLPAPLRKKGMFIFGTVESFTRYFNEHKVEASRIFASVTDTGAKFNGVLNFHGKDPSWRDHECLHVLEETHEWQVWRENNKKVMGQAQFAQFLEENAELFVAPKGAELLEMIQTLEGKSHVNITQGIKLQSGALKLNYSEDVELTGASGTTSQSGSMVLPTLLTVSLSPFQGVAPYEIKGRLRYRIEQRKIVFWYETVDAHLVVRLVCQDTLKFIEKQTGVQPFVC